MNGTSSIKKGTLRISIVLSALSIVLGLMIGGPGGDEDAGLAVGIFGPILIWLCFFGFWFVLKGFEAQQCENCEKNIGKLEEQFKFNEHLVCAECHKKLSEDQKEGIS